MLRDSTKLLDEAGNLDRRFRPTLDPITRLLSKPVERLSAVALGHQWEIISKLASLYKDEIPQVALVQLEQALDAISVLLCQYAEWREYVAEKASSHLNSNEAFSLLAEARNLVEDLSEVEAVDERISVRLNEILAPVLSGIARAESVVPALVGSIHNIYAALAQAALDMGELLAPFFHSGADLATKGAAFGLFSLAVKLLNRFSDNLSKTQPFRFIKASYDLAMKKYPWAKDILFK